ncbi:hypothetical protein [Collimonas sp.]|uniref:hypothetical protein n=1 Tax=Collimonas sp. TaxID=1963772 RepID=UPI002CE6EC4D|nr:hypothetical protein [Collimonas sp.]HWW08410.1 hypothetical protein [Collimonas sp.]
MNKTNLAWAAAALVVGAGGVYAVFSADDSIAQSKPQTVAAAQDHGRSGRSLPGPLAASALSGKAQEAVSINPFGK